MLGLLLLLITLFVYSSFRELPAIEGANKTEESGTYLHQGISARKFKRQFSIADTVEVIKAEMNDGILTINLFNKIPESRKPKTIPIS